MAELSPLAKSEVWEGEGRAPRSLPAHAAPRLSVEGFEGPLDFLLEMVRRQRVDLGRLSILTLTDQLVDAIEDGGGRIPLERRADWLVMASQLLLLKAQLLAPASPEEAEDARAAASRRLELLDELARMRAGADWLTARPQLGQLVFGRGQGTPAQARPQAELYVAFLEATLTMLEGREGQGAEPPPTYRPSPLEFWRIADALQRITELLGQHPAGLPLTRCLPSVPRHAPDRPIRVRAALASTFVAGLELARDGTLELNQREPFDAINFRAVPA
ncbi:segregation and condensation protein A [Roseomonas xinghualingensis]|uniref:segregation and condensation protein A n=1 Tax=Roseomonas xinghualingensis TaxID=2986475 RepID=UPI0021F1AA08|nr:segregation/condensation protein A [Roseomonas sp. SXEYE001]MCV4210181.1 segregation/condensation protein A [Roseomonas sp. SXEYE001]